MSKAYHVVFLILCVLSVLFGMCCAAAGVYIILKHPEASLASVAVEGVSALGFFFARWSQKEFRLLLKDATRGDTVTMLANSRFTQEDVEVFRQFMRMTIGADGHSQSKVEDITHEV